jgi:hypothetical protein
MSEHLSQPGRPGSIDQQTIDNAQVPVDIFVLSGKDTSKPVVGLQAPWKFAASDLTALEDAPKSMFLYQRADAKPDKPILGSLGLWQYIIPLGVKKLWRTYGMVDSKGMPLVPLYTRNNLYPANNLYASGPDWTDPEMINENSTTDVTGLPVLRYIGKYDNTAHPTTPIEGQWWLEYGTTDSPIRRGVYYQTSTGPARIDGGNPDDALFMSPALSDILWCQNNSFGIVSDYGNVTFIANLVANAAFINALTASSAFINNLTVNSLHVVDSSNRTIDINNTLGMRAIDNNSNIIHDLPTNTNMTGFSDRGHLYEIDTTGTIVINPLSFSGANTSFSGNSGVINTNITSKLPVGLLNAKGLLCEVELSVAVDQNKLGVDMQVTSQLYIWRDLAGLYGRTGAYFTLRPKPTTSGTLSYLYNASFDVLFPIFYSSGTPYIIYTLSVAAGNLFPAAGGVQFNGFINAHGIYV